MGSDALVQELGFDASKAIQALTSLDKSMASFETHLGKSVKAMDGLNKKGGATVGLLKKMATEGERAAKALAKVANVQGKLGGSGGTPTPTNVPGVDQYVKQMESMYKVSARATTAQKRAFQSAITSAAEYAAKNKVSMGRVISQSKNLDKSFTGMSNNMANKLNKIETASKKHLNAAGQATRKLSVDFQTMVRIITTQAIVRALSQLRNLIRGAVQDAIEFQTRVAEIGTIAPGTGLDDISQRVKDISDAFNTPLDSTAKAYYQTISNQIGSTTAEFDKFVEAAAKFSKTSVTDLASAVNLGSGALNVYGKSASEAEATFAKFFVTIREGRVVGSELAQGLGTVLPTAEKLGLSLDEVNAALATITIQGVAADKAFTQLRGIFTSFLKPTPEMSAAIKDLGYSTGQSILKAEGLQGALRAVISQTDGSAESIATLIPRVRGLSGGIGLAADKNEHFTKTMNAQKEALQATYDKAYNLVLETDAQKVTKELNILSNFMTTEFGASVLHAAGSMLKFVGGAENLADILRAIVTVAPTVIAAMAGLTAVVVGGMLAIKVAALGLTAALGPLALLLAFPAAAAAGAYIGQKIVDGWDAETQAFVASMEKQRKSRQAKVDAELAMEKQKASELSSLLAKAFSESNKNYFKIADEAVKANKRVLADLKFFTDDMVRDAERAAQAAKAAYESAGKEALASEKRVGKLRSSIDDKVFDHKIKKLEDSKKVFKLVARSNEVSSKAAAQLKKAKTPEQQASATEEFRRAQAFANQALSIAEGTKNVTLEGKALSALKKITNDNIRAEKVYQKTLRQTQVGAAKKAQVEAKRVSDLKTKQKEVLEGYTLYDKKTGEILDSEQRAKKLEGAHKSLKEFIEIATEGKPLDASQMMDFANLSEKMAAEMQGFRIHQIIVDAEALQSLHDTLQEALNQEFTINPAAKSLAAITGKEVSGPKDLAKTLSEVDALYDRLSTAQHAYRTTSGDVTIAEANFHKSLAQTQEVLHAKEMLLARADAGVNNLFGSSGDTKFMAEMDKGLAFLEKAADGGVVSLTELHGVYASLKQTEQGQSFLGNQFTGEFKTNLESTLQLLAQLIQKKKEAAAVQENAPKDQQSLQQVQQQIQMLNQVRESLKQQGVQMLEKPAQDAGQMDTSVNGATSAMSQAVGAAAQLAGYWQTIASSAQATAQASASPSAAVASRGGMMRYLASGGFAQGTDQIPAMLTKGEHVVNAKSSRKFYSQLSAMNANVQPVYRESGGTVTNIGDVAVNITESGSPKQTARQVVSAIRREQRRGSSRL